MLAVCVLSAVAQRNSVVTVKSGNKIGADRGLDRRPALQVSARVPYWTKITKMDGIDP